MIPDDPMIRFIPRDNPYFASCSDACKQLRMRLKRLKKRLYEVPPPQDWRPLGYEWWCLQSTTWVLSFVQNDSRNRAKLNPNLCGIAIKFAPLFESKSAQNRNAKRYTKRDAKCDANWNETKGVFLVVNIEHWTLTIEHLCQERKL